MEKKHLKVFAELNGEELEFWFPNSKKGLEKNLTNTKQDIEKIQQEIDSLQEQKAQREIEISEDEKIAALEKTKIEAALRLDLIKQEITKLESKLEKERL